MIEAKPQKVEILLEAKEVLRHIIEVIEEDDRTARETANYLTSDQEGTFVRAGESSDSLDINNDNNSSNKSSQLTKGFHVYYKPGQNLDNCLIANYAKRVSARILLII